MNIPLKYFFYNNYKVIIKKYKIPVIIYVIFALILRAIILWPGESFLWISGRSKHSKNIRGNYVGPINCHKTVSWYFNANFSVARVLAEDNHRVAHSRQLLLAQRKCSEGLNLDQFNISDALFLAAALFAIAWLYVSVDWRFATAHHREFLLAYRREQWSNRAVRVRDFHTTIFIKIFEIVRLRCSRGADEDAGPTFNLFEDVPRSGNVWARERQRTGQLVATKASMEFISAGKGDSGTYKIIPFSQLPRIPLPSLNVQFKSLVTIPN